MAMMMVLEKMELSMASLVLKGFMGHFVRYIGTFLLFSFISCCLNRNQYHMIYPGYRVIGNYHIDTLLIKSMYSDIAIGL